MKATLKELPFQVGDHTLHNLFRQNLAPPAAKAVKEPNGASGGSPEEGIWILRALQERVLICSSQHRGLRMGGARQVWLDGRLLIMQIEKHNVNVYPAMEHSLNHLFSLRLIFSL